MHRASYSVLGLVAAAGIWAVWGIFPTLTTTQIGLETKTATGGYIAGGSLLRRATK